MPRSTTCHELLDKQKGVRGGQYASRVYVEQLQAATITPSTSRKGNPYDNARIESFYRTPKAEKVHLQDYLDLENTQGNLDRFIGECYNHKRLHSSLGYLPPAKFAAKYYSAQK